jgi:hypothetical protein
MQKSAVLSIALVALAAGCADSGTKEDCIGLSCPAGLLWPDGGEVRIQYIHLPDGNDLRFVVGFFIESQDPPMLQPPILGQCFTDSNYVPPTRVYKDAGESITVTMGSYTAVAPRVEGDAAIDFIGRHHKLAYILETYDKATDDLFDNFHSAVTADDIGLNGRMDGMYMPPKLDVLLPEPGESDGAVRQVKNGQDLLVRWQEINPPNPEVNTAGVILFWKTGQPGDKDAEIIACVGPNKGEFVVPRATIDSLPNSGSIVMQVGTISNQAILTDDDKRIDLWASNCIAFPIVKVE